MIWNLERKMKSQDSAGRTLSRPNDLNIVQKRSWKKLSNGFKGKRQFPHFLKKALAGQAAVLNFGIVITVSYIHQILKAPSPCNRIRRNMLNMILTISIEEVCA